MPFPAYHLGASAFFGLALQRFLDLPVLVSIEIVQPEEQSLFLLGPGLEKSDAGFRGFVSRDVTAHVAFDAVGDDPIVAREAPGEHRSGLAGGERGLLRNQDARVSRQSQAR